MNIHELIRNNTCLLCEEKANITHDNAWCIITDCPMCGKFAMTRELYDDIFSDPHISIDKKAFSDYLISVSQDNDKLICFCEIENYNESSTFKMVPYRKITCKHFES